MQHDDNLGRTTNIAEVFPGNRFAIGLIAMTDRVGNSAESFTLEELRKLDAGSWFDKKFTGKKSAELQSPSKRGTNSHIKSDVGLCCRSKSKVVMAHLFDLISIIYDLFRPPPDHPFRDSYLNLTVNTIKLHNATKQVFTKLMTD